MNLSSIAGLIDPLIHLGDERYEQRDEMLHRATRAGVKHLICGGTNPQKDVQQIYETKKMQPKIWRAFGLHPAEIKADTAQTQMEILSEAIQNKELIAVGEIGLDARAQMPDMLLQERLFLQQLEMARDANLPVIIHAAKAWGRVLLKLKQFGKLPAGGLLHCFGAASELVPEFAKYDLLMSFGGQVTHEKAKKMRKAAGKVPLSLLAAESDGPDHPCTSAKQTYSEPADLPLIYKELGELRGENTALIAVAVTRNLHLLFQRLRSES